MTEPPQLPLEAEITILEFQDVYPPCGFMKHFNLITLAALASHASKTEITPELVLQHLEASYDIAAWEFSPAEQDYRATLQDHPRSFPAPQVSRSFSRKRRVKPSTPPARTPSPHPPTSERIRRSRRLAGRTGRSSRAE
eukprot:gnl/Dysnectes_brevis/4697_a6434_566.p1 GENE.gnl/Dysnectes_brevis/4697_a6434_566~~gnl/Dysnectes_brevis/4697_a6434_566.p1  ORF type:complete len:139 (+),score=16.44 gnl/Dysnectes_brevis/4697_a6434_566:134-550(+)